MLSSASSPALALSTCNSDADKLRLLRRFLLEAEHESPSTMLLANDDALVKEVIKTMDIPLTSFSAVSLVSIWSTVPDNAQRLYRAHSNELVPKLLHKLGQNNPQRLATDEEGEEQTLVLHILMALALQPDNSVHLLANFSPSLVNELLNTYSAAITRRLGNGELAVQLGVFAVMVISCLARPKANKSVLVDRFPKLVPQLVQGLANQNLVQGTLDALSDLLQGSNAPRNWLTSHPALVPSLLTILRFQYVTEEIICCRALDVLCLLAASRADRRLMVASSSSSQDVPLAVLTLMQRVEANPVRVQVSAIHAMCILTTDHDDVKSIFAKHGTALVSVASKALTCAPAFNGDLRYPSSVKLLLRLSKSPSNHDALRSNKQLIKALQLATRSSEPTVANGALITQINLLLGFDGPGMEVTQDMWVKVLAVFDDARDEDHPSEWSIYQPLQALIYLSRLPHNRAAFWSKLGHKRSTTSADNAFFSGLVDTLDNSVYTNDGEGAELMVMVLWYFSQDPAPCQALRVFAPRLKSMFPRLKGNAHQSTVDCATQLLQRLGVDNPSTAAAAVTALNNTTKTGHMVGMRVETRSKLVDNVQTLAHPSLHASLLCEEPHADWDALLHGVAQLDQQQQQQPHHLLNLCLELNAPPHVLEYLVLNKRCDVNEPFAVWPYSTPLMYALIKRNVHAALLFLDHGADVHVRDELKFTPLMQSCETAELSSVTRKLVDVLHGSKDELDYRCRYGAELFDCWALVLCCEQTPAGAGVEQARMLLEAGASPHPLDANVIPLFLAVCKADLSMVKLLLKHGARADVTVAGTPFLASMIVAGDATQDEAVLVELLEVLVAHGAPVPDMLPRVGQLETRSFAQFSIRHGERFPRVVRRWLELGADVNVAMNGAILTGRVADVRLALQLGADPNFAPTDLVTPLHCALSMRANEPARQQLQLEMLHLLLQAGTDPNGTGAPGYPPPLFVAIRDDKNAGAVKLLLQAGANKGTKNRGMRAFDTLFAADRPLLLPLVAERDGEAPGVKVQPCGKFDEAGGLVIVFTHCAGCRKRGDDTNLQACSACIMVAYCGEECQRTHWKQHKKICKKKREMEEKRGG